MFESVVERRRFPPDFLWGAASSAWQIEGALGDGARGESIFARFSPPASPEDTPTQGADHFHRYRQDVELLRRLGVGAWRFSISWPRIFPRGKGKPDPRGIEFYDRLLETLLDADILPVAVIFDGDLPLALEERGGWPIRDTALYFADYALLCVERFGDRVKHWITVNDPRTWAFAGYFEGSAPPGKKDFQSALSALHHLLLAHGEAAAILKELGGDSPLCGPALELSPVYAAQPGEEGEKARLRYDAYLNRSVLDPLFLGTYPDEIAESIGKLKNVVRPGDMERIRSPFDFVGVNYFTCRRVAPGSGPLGTDVAPVEGDATVLGWEIRPSGLREVVERLRNRYGADFIYITANGTAACEERTDGNRIRDAQRVRFLEAHLDTLHSLLESGAPVRGYFHWSLLDGFDWRSGYGSPFGLVAVDRERGFERTPKESFDYFARVIEEGALT